MIAILEDRKGFRKMMHVPKFDPYINIAVFEPISTLAEAQAYASSGTAGKTLVFYPKGQPEESFGEYILLYRETP